MNSPTIEYPPATGAVPTTNEPQTMAPARATSDTTLALCLRRGAAAGCRIVILAPHLASDPAASATRFPERAIKPEAHVYWETGRRLLLRAPTTAADRAAWHVLAVDREGVVIGTVSARFFADETPFPALRIMTLADAAGPIFREQCELAVQETHEAARTTGRMFAEFSEWAVAPGPRQRLVGAMLVRAAAALAAGFDNPLCIFAANQLRRESEPLMRRGAAPLGRRGRFCLPPLIDQRSSAWLRIVLIDTALFHGRCGTDPAAELALLRRRAAIVSVA